MSSDKSSWVPTPRQYRPTYTRLPTSVSNSNFGSPFQRTNTQAAPSSKRRRTASTFPAIDHLHSAPTVASSGLTASVSSNDISHPTPKPSRLSLQSRTRTPTRIPTPVPHIKISSPIRSVSSPAAAPKLKENTFPTAHRLLGPIQPGTVPNNTMTRSRTMSVLFSLTSSFSRSTHSLSSSRSSYGNLLQPPTLNIRQISTCMPPSYWLGRFQALHDRFRSDYLDPGFLDSPEKCKYWTAIPNDETDTEAEPTSSCKGDERLSKRVFTQLEALCTTNEARKSLKAFQQAYARKFECEALLPLGGCMVDREPGFIAKAGRLFSGGRKSSSGMMRRSTLSMSFSVENMGA